MMDNQPQPPPNPPQPPDLYPAGQNLPDLSPSPGGSPRRLLVFAVVLIIVLAGVSAVLSSAAHHQGAHPVLKRTPARAKAAVPSKPAAPQIPPATYTDPKGYFTLQYPGDWVAQPSSLALDSIGGDSWLEEFNFVPSDQAHIVAGSPNYNPFIQGDVVQGPGGAHIVSVEQAAGTQFITKTSLTINNYPAVYTQQKILNSTVDTYIISNQGIAVIITLTEKQGPGIEKAYPNGYDRTSYAANLSAIARSIKFLNSAPSNGLLPGAN
jgi:hypothetical protein